MATTNKSFHVQVGSQLLLVEISIGNEHEESMVQKSSKKQGNIGRDWFKKCHLTELINSLEKIIVGRVNSGRPITRAANQNIENSKDIRTENFIFKYCFKKRHVTTMQFALRQIDTKIYNLNGKTKKNDKIKYESLLYFHEKLTVNISKPLEKKSEQVTNCLQHKQKKVSTKKYGDNIEKKTTSSNYFGELSDCQITSSVKRKKATLRKLAKKSKIALLPKQQAGPLSESKDERQNTMCSQEPQIAGTISGSDDDNNDGDTHTAVQETVIDLEKEPEGLNDIRKVEDLQPDQLKFLVYKMEDYLRSIFRGEVYCRRHEDYNKGGKNRDNLNFQVGMAHFSEDQHDCIMDTLMEIFCYKHLRYMDYVTKVMLPEALIKLYQDIHKTSFEQAEVCLLNDTIK